MFAWHPGKLFVSLFSNLKPESIMKTKTIVSSTLRTLCISCALSLISFTMVGQNMNVAPDVINLNAQGNFENIKCIYGTYIASPVITSHSIQVFFNGTFITQACYVWYCTTDDNLFVEIDRNTFQNHPAVQALVNLGPKALTIVGSFTVLTSTGITIEYAVDRLGYAEIIKPGNKK